MGHLLKVVHISHNVNHIADDIKLLVINKDFLKEMGEPIIYSEDQVWYFSKGIKNELQGFVCHNYKKISYAYTLPEFRGKGVFNHLYQLLPKQNWETNASNMSLPIFLKLGFEVIKSFKICHKLKLTRK